MEKAFGATQVLKRVPFAVLGGEIFAMLGSNGADVFSSPLIFLPLISFAFVPSETMPTAPRVFAEHQPIVSIVNTIRALLENRPVGNAIWVAIAWRFGIMAVACFLVIRGYRKYAL